MATNSNLRILCVQMKSGDDPWENLLWVNDVVILATNNIDLIIFPENTFYRGESPTFKKNLALNMGGEFKEGDFAQALREFAKSWRPQVIIGSTPCCESKQFYNSTLVFTNGRLTDIYHKIHLFQYRSLRASFDEEKEYSAGRKLVAVKCKQFNVGLSVCYDLRFPELYRQLTYHKKCDVLIVPSAFLMKTGQAHWEVLLRARAIENQAYVVAPAQWGKSQQPEGHSQNCYGNSLIVDPWGNVVTRARTTGNQFLLLNATQETVKKVRRKLPVYSSIKLL